MRKTKSIVSALLIASLVLSATACGGSAETTTAAGTTAADTTTTTTEKTTNDTDVSLQEQINSLVQDSADEEKLTVSKKIQWLAWWDIDETAAESELFKTLYGIPEEGSADYGDDADHIFDNQNVAYSQRYVELAKRVQSGDSPDIFPFEVRNYPYSIYQGLFQTIDGVVDLSTEEWSDTKSAMDKFVWGGKYYCAIPEVVTNSVLWYRRSIVAEAGLSDPYELYKNGQWTWDTFLDMCGKFADPDSGKYALDGFSPDVGFIGTTGSALISLDGGKLVSHLYDSNIERVISLLSTMCQNNYRYPRHELNGWQVNYAAWANGDTLFFDDGTWRFEEHWGKYRDRYGWGDDEIFFVPFPKDPNSDEYYQTMKQDAYMFVAGAKNIDGFKAWTKCLIACANDENVRAAQREKDKKDYGWTDEQLDLLYELGHGALSPVFDFKNGIGEDISTSGDIYSTVECLTQAVYVDGSGTYTQLRAENEGVINQRIDELNATTAS